jgi:hypothetical protein
MFHSDQRKNLLYMFVNCNWLTNTCGTNFFHGIKRAYPTNAVLRSRNRIIFGDDCFRSCPYVQRIEIKNNNVLKKFKLSLIKHIFSNVSFYKREGKHLVTTSFNYQIL